MVHGVVARPRALRDFVDRRAELRSVVDRTGTEALLMRSTRPFLVMLLGVCLLACVVPTRRALRIPH